MPKISPPYDLTDCPGGDRHSVYTVDEKGDRVKVRTIRMPFKLF
ncbi:MAG: hypothetical protein ACFE0I_06645 [Elainellaceae cyanobacterium]